MRFHNRGNCHRRSGLALPEWFCILGLIGVGLFMAVGPMGEAASDGLQTTAVGVGDPSQLCNGAIFQDDGSKGNNGVGNGIDGQPPGNPPVNDGPGTSPGNPGNKGGAKIKA